MLVCWRLWSVARLIHKIADRSGANQETATLDNAILEIRKGLGPDGLALQQQFLVFSDLVGEKWTILVWRSSLKMTRISGN